MQELISSLDKIKSTVAIFTKKEINMAKYEINVILINNAYT